MKGARTEILMADSWWADPFDGKGFLLIDRPDKRVWICEDEHGKWQQCTVERFDPLFEQNKQEYNDAPTRMGDMPKVASIPLSTYYRNFLPARQQGDDKHVAKILNDSDFRNLRTRPGKI